MSVEQFRQHLLEGLYQDRENFEIYRITEDESKSVHQLKDEKYGNWDWNFGKSPHFNIQRARRFPIGEIDLRLDVQGGHIKNLKIYGDFFRREPVSGIEERLSGIRYTPADIREALA